MGLGRGLGLRDFVVVSPVRLFVTRFRVSKASASFM